MSSLLSGLNREQYQAVTTTEGPVLVLAGAGTGKTRVITVRMAHLLDQGVSPDHVLAMTFTNKAAREMRERVGGLVGKKRAKALTVGTFHSFCARTLREHAERLGLPQNYTICDAGDQASTLKGVMRELHVPDAAIQPGAALSRISLFKNRLIDPAGAAAAARDDTDELVAMLYERYDAQLRRSRTLDFDDLLVWTHRLLADHADVAAAFSERFRYVMVDEYQDTNGPQYEIVRQIVAPHRNLCVVGDDDQSIYGWRGADVAKILGFEQDFPGATVIRLETNYRSTARILDAANRVIAHNTERHDKTLRSGLDEGHHPAVQRHDDETEEADWLAADIHGRLMARVPPEHLAVLFRTQQQPRALESALRAARIPYTLVGGQSFFDRKEIRDVLAYVRLLANPDDEPSFLRIVNRPARGIGKGSVDKVLELATDRGVGAREAFDLARHEGLLSAAAEQGYDDLTAVLGRFAGSDPGKDLVQHLAGLIEAVQYRVEIDRAYSEAKVREDRWRGVLEVLDLAENYVTRASRPTLNDFLERLSLSTGDDDEPGRKGSVTLMTLHGAKGLEFPEVYMVGCEEGLLPHQRSVDEDTVPEERRLMYVGITRAQRRLVLSFAASRSRFGHRAASMPSRFLFEMTGEEPPEGWQACPTTEARRAQAARGGPGQGKKTRRKVARRKATSSDEASAPAASRGTRAPRAAKTLARGPARRKAVRRKRPGPPDPTDQAGGAG